MKPKIGFNMRGQSPVLALAGCLLAKVIEWTIQLFTWSQPPVLAGWQMIVSQLLILLFLGLVFSLIIPPMYVPAAYYFTKEFYNIVLSPFLYGELIIFNEAAFVALFVEPILIGLLSGYIVMTVVRKKGATP
jgi:membrane-associated HD superfamily phosphohydrolase